MYLIFLSIKNRANMIRNIITIFFLTLLFTSCGASSTMINADSNMRKVQIGMSKEQVIEIVGKHYEVIAATEYLEVIGYKSSVDEIYLLRFENNLLVEWHKEWLRQERFRPSEE